MHVSGVLVKTGGHVPYASKMDDFEAFVAHAKLATLNLQPVTGHPANACSQSASQSSPQPQMAKVTRFYR